MPPEATAADGVQGLSVSDQVDCIIESPLKFNSSLKLSALRGLPTFSVLEQVFSQATNVTVDAALAAHVVSTCCFATTLHLICIPGCVD